MGAKVLDCGVVRAKAIAPGIERIDGFFPPSFLALQTTRMGGSSLGAYASFNLATHVEDDPVAVAANRARLASHLPATPLWLHQVHGTAIAECVTSDVPQADAGIAQDFSTAAVVMTADCLPLLVARPATGQCAAIHAGWRGLAAGVIETTLDRMAATRAPSASAGDDHWYAWIGPAIGPKAFEVGRDVVDAFVHSDPGAMTAFVLRDSVVPLPLTPPSDTKAEPADLAAPHKWLADLSGLARRKLAHWAASFRGAATLSVAYSNECTFLDAERYFSFRRDRVTGRMASLICRLS